MNKKSIPLIVFILVALVQLSVPAKMIYDKEDTLATGKPFKFKTVPIDPEDPFRGKYITLRFTENSIQLQKKDEWSSNETVYLLLETDSQGFAKINAVSKVKPFNNPDYVKAKVDYRTYSDSVRLFITYPFERFYMDETKSHAVEQIYQKSLMDTSNVTYALVNIKGGDAVIKDILINGVSIHEIVKAANKTGN